MPSPSSTRVDGDRRRLVLVGLAVLAAMLAAAALWFGYAARKAARTAEAITASNEMLVALLDLDQLTGDYFASGDERPLRQWAIRHADVEAQLARMAEPGGTNELGPLRREWQGMTALSTRLQALARRPGSDRIVAEQLQLQLRSLATRAAALHREWVRRGASLQRWMLSTGGIATLVLLAWVVVVAALYVRTVGSLARVNMDLERKNAELEQFAYAASHDLQEPLRMVSSYLDLLRLRQGDRLDEAGRRWLVTATEGALRMLAMIRALLDYARAGAEAPLEEVDAGAAAREALANLQRTVDICHARIDIAELPRVRANRVQLVQVFQNLIGNGIKFRADRPPHIRVTARDGGGEWILCVADNGMGIPTEHRGQLFRLFRRLHDGSAGGTGIGLVTCKRIVENHGGRIWIEPDTGQGTAFSFALPKA